MKKMRVQETGAQKTEGKGSEQEKQQARKMRVQETEAQMTEGKGSEQAGEGTGNGGTDDRGEGE